VSWFPLSPLIVLLLAALLIWAINERARAFTQGWIALLAIVAALGLVVGGQALGLSREPLAFVWSTLNGQPITARITTSGGAGFFSAILLLCGAVTAGGLAWTLGRSTRAFGLVFAGLLLLLLGGLLTAYSGIGFGALVGLGVAWLGGTIMQQVTMAHNREATFAGLPLLLLALALLIFSLTPQLNNAPLNATWWLAGCFALIGLAPRWGAAPTAPLLVRAPVAALGLPLLGGYLLLTYATSAAGSWPAQTGAIVLLLGVAGMLVGGINALTARRIGEAFSWQLVAQLALLAVCFGTRQPAAGPIAAGLLAHTVVTSVSIALAIGQYERVTRSDRFAELPPLSRPLRRAGIAYGLAAVSAAGIPPLLGYGLRRVVLLIAVTQPWLPAVLLGVSSLLALSYLPTLVAFFRRPAFRSPIATVDQSGGGWPLALMCGLLVGGLLPDSFWQWILGDPTVPQPQLPPPGSLLTTGLLALLVLALFGVINRALRNPRPGPQFTGGEPLDEEPGWSLPFAALRTLFSPLIVPEQPPGRMLAVWLREQRDRLTTPLQALERQYYLAIIVVSLISVLLLAT
jgi:formate hydrogenlyase subunit 3/multisubunit Na+/H+ antiporter MnhD subunit